MKEYIKMGDVFDYKVTGVDISRMARGGLVNSLELAAHAINSHDELVAINKDLLAALEMVWKSAEHAYDGASGSYLMFDDERDIVNSAIAKAKGSAA